MQDKFQKQDRSDNDRLIDELLRDSRKHTDEAEFAEEAADEALEAEHDAPIEPEDTDAAAAYETSSADEIEFEPPEPVADESGTEDEPAEAAPQKPVRRSAASVPRARLTASDLEAGDSVRRHRAEEAAYHREKRTNAGKPAQTGSRRSAAKRKKKRRRNNLPFVLVWTTLMVAIGIVMSVTIIALGKDAFAIGKEGTDKIVVVQSGADTAEIAQMLYDEDIIRVPKLFQLMSRLKGADGSYVAGEHVVNAGDTYEQIIVELSTTVKAKTTTVTFTEGTTLIEAAKALEEAKVCEASRFIYCFNAGGYGYGFEKKLPTDSGSKFYKMEGYLFPDTYEFYIDMEPELVCQKIYARFDEIMEKGVIEKTGKTYYETLEEMNYSLDYIITLASVIQQEAPTISSMQMVSSVFWNRLNNSDMFPKLQSDPTTKYVNEVIKPNIAVANEVIFQAYDTYRGPGLPPGAICSPGKNAIEAALNPASSKYYFFCANIDTKQILYAVTNEEHEANLAEIQKQQAGDDAVAAGKDGTTDAGNN